MSRRRADLEEQIVRSRAAITRSRESIARCEDRIGESIRLLALRRSRFDKDETAFSDEQQLGATELNQAQQQQREIEREVHETLRLSSRRS